MIRRLLLVLALTPALLAEPAGQWAHRRWEQLQATGKYPLSKNASELSRVERIGNRLVQASRRPVQWEFHVIDRPDINAASLGEGVILVFQGLLDLQLDDDELAGVLAHEVAHGTEQHSEKKELVKRQLLTAAQEADRIDQELARTRVEVRRAPTDVRAQDRLEQLTWRQQSRRSELEKQIRNLEGQNAHRREFAHEQEYEADVVGMRYAVEAGFRADGQARALENMRSAIATLHPGFTGECDTHPSMERRQETLRKVMQSWKPGSYR